MEPIELFVIENGSVVSKPVGNTRIRLLTGGIVP